MLDFEARHIIEALRSGVPSRAVGAYFSEARPAMLNKVRTQLDEVRETGRSGGMVFTGRYGEGKTHLLNTAFNLATESNMAVSFVSLGKESPLDKPYLLYQKLVANTFLPGSNQPGFRARLEELTPGSAVAGELLAYAAKELETDKLYYLLRAFLGTQEEDERSAFLADLEGEFAPVALIKRSYRRITGKAAKLNQNFSKVKHGMDYFCFLSHLLRVLGCDGWVLLFDEAELLGRLGKKARAKSYANLQAFLKPSPKLEGTFSLFAFSASYAEDVIEKKREAENVETVFAEEPELLKAAQTSLAAIENAPELAPLTRAEILRTLESIRDFHFRAYEWRTELSAEALYAATEAGGYLLRTRIRAAIELLDQLYQYGSAADVRIAALTGERYDEEDDVPELPELEES